MHGCTILLVSARAMPTAEQLQTQLAFAQARLSLSVISLSASSAYICAQDCIRPVKDTQQPAFPLSLQPYAFSAFQLHFIRFMACTYAAWVVAAAAGRSQLQALHEQPAHKRTSEQAGQAAALAGVMLGCGCCHFCVLTYIQAALYSCSLDTLWLLSYLCMPY